MIKKNLKIIEKKKKKEKKNYSSKEEIQLLHYKIQKKIQIGINRRLNFEHDFKHKLIIK